MENVSFNVPNHPAVLRAMAAYFLELAGGAPMDTRCLDDFAGGNAQGFDNIKAYAGAESIPLSESEPPTCETPVQVPAQTTPAAPETASAPQPPADPAQATGHSDGVELDADGLPWDSRIHSSSKKRGQSGRWNLRRNVPDETRNAVVAELRAAMAAGADVPDPITPPAADGSLFAESPAPAPAVVTQNAAPAPVAAPAAKDAPVTFADYISQAAAFGDAASQAACLSIGLPNVAMLATRPDLIPQVWAKLTQGGAS